MVEEASSPESTPLPNEDGPATSLRVTGVIETTLNCADLEAAERFYTTVLGFEVFAKEEGRHLFFRCGEAMLLLFNPEHTATKVTKVGGVAIPLHGGTGSGHVAFRATAAEIDAWRVRLAEHNVGIEADVHWPEGGRSIYFRDPADNCLEFITPTTWGLD